MKLFWTISAVIVAISCSKLLEAVADLMLTVAAK